jgi:membrane-associated protease RseP (regulator of RpoE activity)
MQTRLRLISCALAFVHFGAHAQSDGRGALESELGRAVDNAIADAVVREGAPAKPLVISHPEQQRFELGAVLDLRSTAPEGLIVLALTPGGAGERMGLMVGDQIVEINGYSMLEADGLVARLKEALASDDGQVQALLLRGKQPVDLSGAADLIRIPAYTLNVSASAAVEPSGCGFVSGGAKTYGGVAKVDILEVDGKPAPTDLIGRLTLPAGRYTLTLRSRPRLGMLQESRMQAIRTRTGESAMAPGDQVTKPDRGMPADPEGARVSHAERQLLTMELVVQADTSYQLGARAREGQPGVEAFVFSESPRSCR